MKKFTNTPLYYKNLVIAMLLLFSSTRLDAQNTFWFNYNNEDGLPSIETYDVVSDHKGFLWISTDKGLTKYNGKSFKNFTTKHGLPTSVVGRLSVSKKGRIYLVCDFSDNLIYYIENDEIKPYQYKGKLETPIQHMEFDENDDIVGITTHLKYFRKQNGKFEEVKKNTTKNTIRFSDQNNPYIDVENFLNPDYYLFGYKITSKANNYLDF